jgi:hypothetical protein
VERNVFLPNAAADLGVTIYLAFILNFRNLHLVSDVNLILSSTALTSTGGHYQQTFLPSY